MAQSREIKNLKARIRYHNRRYGTRYRYEMFKEMDLDPSKIRFTRGKAEFDYSKISRTKPFDEGVLDNFLDSINNLRDYFTNTSIEYTIRTVEEIASSIGRECAAYGVASYIRTFGNADYTTFYEKDAGISSSTIDMIEHIITNAEEYLANKYGETDEEFEYNMEELENIRDIARETFGEDVENMFLS